MGGGGSTPISSTARSFFPISCRSRRDGDRTKAGDKNQLIRDDEGAPRIDPRPACTASPTSSTQAPLSPFDRSGEEEGAHVTRGGDRPTAAPLAGQQTVRAIDYACLSNITLPAGTRVLPIWQLLSHLEIDTLAPPRHTTRTRDGGPFLGGGGSTGQLLLYESDCTKTAVRALISRRVRGHSPIISGTKVGESLGPAEAKAEEEAGAELKAARDEAAAELLLRRQPSSGDSPGAGSGLNPAVRTTGCTEGGGGEEGSGGAYGGGGDWSRHPHIVVGTTNIHGLLADAIVEHCERRASRSRRRPPEEEGGGGGAEHAPGNAVEDPSEPPPELTNALATLVAVQTGVASSLLPHSRSKVMSSSPKAPGRLLSYRGPSHTAPAKSGVRSSGARCCKTMGSESRLVDVRLRMCGG